jgi:glycosyltransferase involved in cell wall biosynthesis
MKVAVVHEWLIDWAGSERVLEQILCCFPQADLFSLVDFLSDENRGKLRNKRATTSFLQSAPFAKSHLHFYLPLMPIAVEQFDLSKYDLIISSSHAVAKGIITGPDQLHISYVHSPMRYAWDLQHDYLQAVGKRSIKGLALRAVLHYLRQWDVRTANGVDKFIANSEFVAKRIMKFYRRHANVIYPPVDIERFVATDDKDDSYVCVGRLEPYKRVDAIVEAFRKMPRHRLTVIGGGSMLKSIRRSVPENVAVLGHQSDEAVRDHLQKAKALIFAGTEDFGITLIEAQACGTPVIAYGNGGARESIIPLGTANPTGLFFDEQDSDAIAAAVNIFENNQSSFTAENCRRNSTRFSCEKFRSDFTAFVQTQTGKLD